MLVLYCFAQNKKSKETKKYNIIMFMPRSKIPYTRHQSNLRSGRSFIPHSSANFRAFVLSRTKNECLIAGHRQSKNGR